ncbi:6-phosphogluconate dehydrogenase, decarboxylating [Pleurostoma richardsiae]|uniref:6-phosphogluconate dehydrogenase, decarboxylating n=1 Tax=Pleurostoma richardsiae TaxID=41990 RepID=A0AA38RF40_9PEZI|nr:6-phosphogluconate dehydrogenase, decarboxylating [Pleurostoma richardsiae]
MSLLFAESGCRVFYFDPKEEQMEAAQGMAKDVGFNDKIVRQSGYEEICKSLESDSQPRLIIFSIPHGTPGDKCVEALRPHLKKGDIILDCSNEHWNNTERRQKDLESDGIYYLGCGVSGGYQSARAGPSMTPGGKKEALEKVLPLLRKVAAKDSDGKPCTGAIGPGGSGHYVKMVHNGIEQGMMSVIAEVWYILTKGLELPYEKVADIFEAWNESEGLRNCFLVFIGVDINRARDENGQYVLDKVQDKVVQDVDESEGTGTWTCEEAVRMHVPAATILSAHLFRCASADLARRIANKNAAGGGVPPGKILVDSIDEFVETLRRATYFCFLLSFVQGMNTIRKKDVEDGWGINYLDVLQAWKNGCIIRADDIVSLLEQAYSRADHDKEDLLSNEEVAGAVAAGFSSTKSVVLKAVEADMVVPAISQSLEHFKYSTSTELPTQFVEAQLDYFGEHMFDLKSEPPGVPVTGSHHFEWKPARGKVDEEKGK